jgi:hypothetical protein
MTTVTLISQVCTPSLLGTLSIIVVIESLIIIVQQVLLHTRGLKPK